MNLQKGDNDLAARYFQHLLERHWLYIHKKRERGYRQIVIALLLPVCATNTFPIEVHLMLFQHPSTLLFLGNLANLLFKLLHRMLFQLHFPNRHLLAPSSSLVICRQTVQKTQFSRSSPNQRVNSPNRHTPQFSIFAPSQRWTPLNKS